MDPLYRRFVHDPSNGKYIKIAYERINSVFPDINLRLTKVNEKLTFADVLVSKRIQKASLKYQCIVKKHTHVTIRIATKSREYIVTAAPTSGNCTKIIIGSECRKEEPYHLD